MRCIYFRGVSFFRPGIVLYCIVLYCTRSKHFFRGLKFLRENLRGLKKWLKILRGLKIFAILPFKGS